MRNIEARDPRRWTVVPLVWMATTAVLMAAACLGPDTTPPPPPSVDPVRSPTSLPSQTIAGAAEYGSRVRIERDPALPDGAVETIADAFTARWSAELPLAENTENRLTLTAVDAAGNRSAATEIHIVHEPPVARTVSLDLTPPLVDESLGVMEAAARISHPEPGVSLGGQTITFDLHLQPAGQGAVPVTESRTATTGGDGRATVVFQDLVWVGEGHVRATAPGGAEAQSAFLVHGRTAGPVDVELTLSAEVDGVTEGPADAISVPAGTRVRTHAVLTDAGGNVVDRPVVISTDAPGAIVEVDAIDGLTRPGTWTVTATTPGTGLFATATVAVVAGAPTDVHLDVFHRSIPVGMPLPYAVRVEDAFGNAVDWPFAIRTEPGDAVVDETNQIVTFGSAGDFDVIAESEVAEETLVDRRGVRVTATTDGAAPQVAFVVPGLSMVTGTAAGPTFVQVAATASSGLAEIRLQIRGPSDLRADAGEILTGAPTSATVDFRPTLPSGADQDELTLLASAVDAEGRITVSDPLVVRRVSSPNPAPGHWVREVHAGAPLDRPMGVALTADGAAIVANHGGSNLVRVDLSTGDTEPFAILDSAPYDVARDDVSGHYFVTTTTDREVARVDTSGEVLDEAWGTGGNRSLRGIDVGGDDPRRVYVMSRRDDRVDVYDPGLLQGTDRLQTVQCDLNDGWGVAFAPLESDADTRILYITRENSSRLYRCRDDWNDDDRSRVELQGVASFSDPKAVLWLAPGDVLVASRGNGRLIRVWRNGDDWQSSSSDWSATEIVTGVGEPVGLALSEDRRRVYFTSEEGAALYELWLPVP